MYFQTPRRFCAINDFTRHSRFRTCQSWVWKIYDNHPFDYGWSTLINRNNP